MMKLTKQEAEDRFPRAIEDFDSYEPDESSGTFEFWLSHDGTLCYTFMNQVMPPMTFFWNGIDWELDEGVDDERAYTQEHICAITSSS